MPCLTESIEFLTRNCFLHGARPHSCRSLLRSSTGFVLTTLRTENEFQDTINSAAMQTIPKHWPFEDPPNMAVITTRQVTEHSAPILLVSHDADDGGWQFLTGASTLEDDARVVAMRTIWILDPSVGELADLPLGWHAWRRSSQTPWQRSSRNG